MGDKICGYTQHHKNRKEALLFVQHKSGHNGEIISDVFFCQIRRQDKNIQRPTWTLQI